jgi:Copper binding proteins, plastocyanin/azurin family
VSLLAALLATIALGGGQAEDYRIVKVTHYGIHRHRHKTRRACRRHSDRHCRKHVHRRRVRLPAPRPSPPGPAPAPAPAPPAPAPDPGPAPSPDPPGPALPSRTGVDLTDDDANGWRVTPAYRVLKAGDVEFNASNLGMDDHDFSIRNGAGTVLATEFLPPGEGATVRLTLAPAVYTLFCSLPGHEEVGMRADVTVR